MKKKLVLSVVGVAAVSGLGILVWFSKRKQDEQEDEDSLMKDIEKVTNKITKDIDNISDEDKSKEMVDEFMSISDHVVKMDIPLSESLDMLYEFSEKLQTVLKDEQFELARRINSAISLCSDKIGIVKVGSEMFEEIYKEWEELLNTINNTDVYRLRMLHDLESFYDRLVRYEEWMGDDTE